MTHEHNPNDKYLERIEALEMRVKELEILMATLAANHTTPYTVPTGGNFIRTKPVRY